LTEDNIAKLHQAINNAKITNKYLSGVFIDFEKAYDMACDMVYDMALRKGIRYSKVR